MILKKFRKNKDKFFHIILSFGSIVASIAVLATIFLFPFSADDYTQVIPDSFDIMRVVSNSTGDFALYNNSGSSYYCKFSSSSSVSTMTYGTTPLTQVALSIHEDTLYTYPYWFEKLSGTTQFSYNILLPFDYMVKGGDTFTVVLGGTGNSSTYNIQVLTSEGDLLNCTVSATELSATQTVSDGYLQWYINSFAHSYKYYRKNNGSTANSTVYRYGYLTTVTLPGTDTYYSISSISISENLSNVSTYSYFTPAVQFLSLPPYYENVPSGGGDYSAQFDEVIAKLDDVNDKLDIVTGEPPSEAASEFDSKSSEVDDLIDEALENASIVHEAEQMPTTYFDDPQGNNLPQNPQNGELDDYNSVFTIFSQFPLINQIIFSGGVCLVFFTLLRRW